MTPSNLKLFVTPEDYDVFAGPSWPAYQDFLEGARSLDPVINQEIDDLIAMKKKEGIKFPVRSKTACQSKWTWSTIYLNYTASASCHRVTPIPFELEEFDNFHNLPKKIADRKLMLAGEWPTGGCEYCKDIEDAGGWSDRQHNLEIRGLTPPELETDPTALVVTPRLVEIFAQNTCNLQCTYCNGHLSSKIEQENKKFGEFNQGGVHIPVVDVAVTKDAYFERFISWLDDNIHNLRRMHLLGGETFLQHKLMNRVLEVIERRPNPLLELCILSNMNVPDSVWDQYVPRIKALQQQGHIKVFNLTASIDCWGPEQEYARFGLDLEKFEKRFAWCVEQGDWLRLTANQAVTCLTMKTMPDLVEKIAYYSQFKEIGHYFMFYSGPYMFQHPKIFAYDFWKPSIDRVLELMPTRTDNQREAIVRMQGMVKYLQTFKQNNTDEIRKLHVYLDELDRRRGSDWRKIFPYLV